MRKLMLALLLGVCCVGLGFDYPSAPIAKKEEPKSISDVMNAAMKGGLNRKVISGEATDEEKLEFLNLMIDLVENDPPQGDAAEWKNTAGLVMLTAAKVVVGREGAGDALKDAANCKRCHDIFKPAE